jgi:hypothetical protein
MPNRTTITLDVTRDERQMLRRMTSRPEQPGATEGPLRIEEVRDVRADNGSVTVQVVVSVPGGEADPRATLEDALRRRMAEVQPSEPPAADGRMGGR